MKFVKKSVISSEYNVISTAYHTFLFNKVLPDYYCI